MEIILAVFGAVVAVGFSIFLLEVYVKSTSYASEYGVSAWVAGIIAILFTVTAIALAAPKTEPNRWDLTNDESNALFQCAKNANCDASALHRSFMGSRGD